MTSLFKSVLLATALSSVAIAPAWADPYGYHGGGHGGGHGAYYGNAWGALGLALFGTAVILAATAPPPPYYPAPVYPQQVYPPQPVVVTQMAPQPAPVPEQNWWYYCAKPAGYYPYVKACPMGWTKVSPIPPDR
jgi:hypothetical protein